MYIVDLDTADPVDEVLIEYLTKNFIIAVELPKRYNPGVPLVRFASLFHHSLEHMINEFWHDGSGDMKYLTDEIKEIGNNFSPVKELEAPPEVERPEPIGKVITVEVRVDGEDFRYFVLYKPSPTGGINPISSETDLMVYGNRQDRDESARWHYFPTRNVKAYSVGESKVFTVKS